MNVIRQKCLTKSSSSQMPDDLIPTRQFCLHCCASG
jgi:hypothetical protein